MCVRGEEMDGRLVAWSAAGFAMGWDVAYLEKAARYAASIREEIHPSVRPWAAAMAEGDLEALSPDGEGILAWGSALLWAAALAESAGPGQVLVHDELHARHGDDLNVVEALAAGDSSQASRYWQLDLDRPWLSGRAEEEVSARRSQPVPARLVDAIAELRRARARVGGRSPSAQCQAALALAMMLANAGRPEEALLDALDALARARETNDPKATGACMALLAKLYAGAGLSDEASALREGMAG
jgi:hypothetical protein